MINFPMSTNLMSITQSNVKSATTQAELKRKVVYFSICSRLFIIFLSFISNLILPDHNAGVYMFPSVQQNETFADRFIEGSFGGLSRWDAQYFLHISHHGYSYENTLAFFPFFPLLTRILARGLEVLTGSLINTLSTVLISAVTLNFIFFIGAAVKLFDLSCVIFKDDKLAYIAALFFCINPASIFFTAPYSESCFSFFAFSGMLFHMKTDNTLLSSFAFGLSCCVRSNGIINIGFIAHKSLRYFVQFVRSKKLSHAFHTALIEMLKFIIYSLVLLAPFAMFHIYVYLTFCLNKTSIPLFLKAYGESKGFVMPDEASPPWCNYTFPISYSYIQSHYWNVEFLKYYTLKQIPNFLLALPIIFFILSNSYLFLAENKKSLNSLGLSNTDFVTFCGRNMRPEFFVFVFHSMILTVFCALCIHVQVTTRMIASSCPVLYWFVALRCNFGSLTAGDSIKSRLKTIQNPKKYSMVESQANMNSFWKTVVITEKSADLHTKMLRLYFCSYALIGTILFSNFYPWT